MMSADSTQASVIPTIPKGPIFGWASLKRDQAPAMPAVDELPHLAYTTSGRAAIYQALLQMDLRPDAVVLVPSYHCPTMVAPIQLAGHQPAFFDIRKDGLPDLDRIDPDLARRAEAMIVTQYFGLCQSLHEVRDWCDARGIQLIEDCAHCFFGQAGSRQVGAWGDYCTASLSKFFPVPEAGLLASAHHPLRPLKLERQTLRAQVKGCVDVIELATHFERLPGINLLMKALFMLKGGARKVGTPAASPSAPPVVIDVRAGCDMGRINRRALWISMLIRRIVPVERIRARRTSNYRLYGELLAGLPGMSELARLPKSPAAPYVFPVWIEDADRVYHGLRALGVPVFRWDQIWPGTPQSKEDLSPRWSRHLLQLLCHQDLREDDIRYSVRCLLSLLPSPGGAVRHASVQTEIEI